MTVIHSNLTEGTDDLIDGLMRGGERRPERYRVTVLTCLTA